MHRRYVQVLEALPSAVVACDGAVVEVANHAAAVIFGHSHASALVGVDLNTFVLRTSNDELKVFSASGINASVFELMMCGADGIERLIKVRRSAGPGKDENLTLFTFEDLSELRALKEALLHQAGHDLLTNLPNRRLTLDYLAATLSRSGRLQAPVSVLFIDLDGFKHVTDTLGHDAGDILLVEVARRLRGNTRAGEIVGRLASDEFVSIIEGDGEMAKVAAERMLVAIAEPIELGGSRNVELSASIGVAMCTPDVRLSAEELLRRADRAMMRAKKLGKNRLEISTQEDQAQNEQLAE